MAKIAFMCLIQCCVCFYQLQSGGELAPLRQAGHQPRALGVLHHAHRHLTGQPSVLLYCSPSVQGAGLVQYSKGLRDLKPGGLDEYNPLQLKFFDPRHVPVHKNAIDRAKNLFRSPFKITLDMRWFRFFQSEKTDILRGLDSAVDNIMCRTTSHPYLDQL